MLLTNAQKLGFSLNPDQETDAKMVNDATNTPVVPPALATAIKNLWASEPIQSTYKLRDKKFALNESAAYFFNAVERISQPGYLPSVDDVLRARVRSTGIEEAEFQFKDMSFRMFDVGGQRSERRKWIHCFENVTAVLFVISLVGYDQVLREDESQNCMKESLLLFDEIINSPWFADTAFILFLNKLDLFSDKLAATPLTDCFPDYSGSSEENALAFIQTKFVAQKSFDHVGRAQIFCHRTSAIDTKQFSTVFSAVRSKLLNDILRETGVLL